MLRLAWRAVLVGLASAGCAFPLVSSSPQACPAALLEGTLVRDDKAGLTVLVDEVDVAYPVEWPDGWTIRDVLGERHLFDAGGRDIGSEGDHVSAGGGFTSGPVEVFQPCGPIRISPAT